MQILQLFENLCIFCGVRKQENHINMDKKKIKEKARDVAKFNYLWDRSFLWV
jgi:hypothetical protein